MSGWQTLTSTSIIIHNNAHPRAFSTSTQLNLRSLGQGRLRELERPVKAGKVSLNLGLV